MSRNRNLIFYGVLCCLVLLSIELGNQFLIFIHNGRFIWSHPEQFNIRPFTMSVADARVVTLKPNYAASFKDEWGLSPWFISTDAWGFRKGTHATDPACSNLVFIGASVPFGWGVPDAASLPSKVYDQLRAKNDPHCVINAAIPSSTLFQAVARYDHEIHGRIKVDVVFLQIYDPVSQLLILGSHWMPAANWATYSRLGFDQTGARLYSLPLAGYSATVAILQRTLQYFGIMPTHSDYIEVFSQNDHATLEYFRQSIRDALEHLHAMMVSDGARQLFLGSLAVPANSRSAPWFSDARRFVIDIQNGELQRFAREHKDAVYVDTAALLSAKPDRQIYIDACCHLSEYGNELVAEQIVPLLRPFNAPDSDGHKSKNK